MKPCCKPTERDDDRTHTIRYTQEYYDGEPGDPPVMEEHGTLTISCSHNDAIADAAVAASGVEAKHGIGMFEVRPGVWRAREYERGEGTKFEVRVYRGPGEEDYDAGRT